MTTICWPGGGWDVISAQIQATNVPDNYFSLLKGTEPSYVLWLILPMFIYTLIGQDVYQRLFAAKDTKAGAFAGLFSGLAFVALGWSGFSFFGIPSDIASSLLSLAVLIVVSLITYKPESAA